MFIEIAIVSICGNCDLDEPDLLGACNAQWSSQTRQRQRQAGTPRTRHMHTWSEVFVRRYEVLHPVDHVLVQHRQANLTPDGQKRADGCEQHLTVKEGEGGGCQRRAATTADTQSKGTQGTQCRLTIPTMSPVRFRPFFRRSFVLGGAVVSHGSFPPGARNWPRTERGIVTGALVYIYL